MTTAPVPDAPMGVVGRGRTDHNLTIITDSREQRPLRYANLPSQPGGLYTGDYSAKGLEEIFVVERKTIADLVGSLTAGRTRFMNELHPLQGKALVVGEFILTPSQHF